MNNTAWQGTDTLENVRKELESLATEGVDKSLSDIDQRSTLDLVVAMNEFDKTVPLAVATAIPAITAAVDAIASRLKSGGRLIYVGAGTPGRLGILDASECPPTFGTDPSMVVGVIAGGSSAIHQAVEAVEDDTAAGAHDLAELELNAQDAVVGISASGRTPYVIGALEYAEQVGAMTIGLACNEDSRVGTIARIPIEVPVGAEFIAGSTRLKAGTAQKLVLNMLTTLCMVRLGKTYGNVMVDLQATNEKLVARAERTIMAVTGVEANAAARALSESDGSVKIAILALKRGLAPAVARDVLSSTGGNLRQALDDHLVDTTAKET